MIIMITENTRVYKGREIYIQKIGRVTQSMQLAHEIRMVKIREKIKALYEGKRSRLWTDLRQKPSASQRVGRKRSS